MGLISESFGLRVAFACVSVLLIAAAPLAILAARLPIRTKKS